MPKKKENVIRRTMLVPRADRVISLEEFKEQLDHNEVKNMICIPDGFGGSVYLLHLPSALRPPLPIAARSVVASSIRIEPAMTQEERIELHDYLSRKTAELTRNLKERVLDAIDLAVTESSLAISIELLGAIGQTFEPELLVEQEGGTVKLRFRYSGAIRGYISRTVIGRKGGKKKTQRFRNRTHFLRVARQKASDLENETGSAPTRAALALAMYPRYGSPDSELRDDLIRYEVSFKDEIKKGLKKGALQPV